MPNLQSSIKQLSPAFAHRYQSNEYKAIFETLLLGSFILVAILTLLLLLSYFALNNTHVGGRIFVCGTALLYLAATQGAWARQHYSAASRMLILFYYSIAIFVMAGWGVDTTFSQLMLAITIVIAGILLGSRAALLTAGASIGAMLLVQIAVSIDQAPWFADAGGATTFGDVLGFSTLLGILALISALFSKHTQEMHAKDRRVNEALAKERGSLELRMQSHSQQLKNLQLEEIDQLYKFAEIGQLSAALLHDIANHLAVLNIDLADLKRQQRTKAVQNLEESIHYIEKVISQAQGHLQIKDAKRPFNVLGCIEDSIKLPQFQESRIAITVSSPAKRVRLYGESLRFSHILIIIIRNAIESYPEGTPPNQRLVTIRLEITDNDIVIRVQDKGRGISPALREKLFMPLRSAKKDGLGLGLFIAKKITETHFNGSLTLEDTTEHTSFVLTIPKKS